MGIGLCASRNPCDSVQHLQNNNNNNNKEIPVTKLRFRFFFFLFSRGMVIFFGIIEVINVLFLRAQLHNCITSIVIDRWCRDRGKIHLWIAIMGIFFFVFVFLFFVSFWAWRCGLASQELVVRTNYFNMRISRLCTFNVSIVSEPLRMFLTTWRGTDKHIEGLKKKKNTTELVRTTIIIKFVIHATLVFV